MHCETVQAEERDQGELAVQHECSEESDEERVWRRLHGKRVSGG